MLAVTGIGMVSPLGLDAISSCAAARAGIQRIMMGDDVFVDDLDGKAVPVAVHRVPRISAGLFGFTRLLQLGQFALYDLLRTTPALREDRVGMILIVDGGSYQEALARRRRQEAEEATADNARAHEPPAELANDDVFGALRTRIVNDLLSTLVKRVGLEVAPQFRVTLAATTTGLVPALRQAEEWLSLNVCDRCIVGAIDSLIDPPTLAALDDLGLLRTPNRAVGISPGEAACFLALESPRQPRSRPAPIRAFLDCFSTSSESAHPLLVETSPHGGGLRAAIAETLSRLPDGGRTTGLVVANMNGDPYRAMSWGSGAISTDSPVRIGSLPIWIPALHFGDVGAATGPLSVAMLVRGWDRQYAPSANALVCLMDDMGARSVLSARAPKAVAA
ncbi:MAG TPA: hypothetical protein VGP07_04495 [Polyangia bacterium]|jgi:3-oxoacyl-[acyl-carrier-protein] synthase-1